MATNEREKWNRTLTKQYSRKFFWSGTACHSWEGLHSGSGRTMGCSQDKIALLESFCWRLLSPAASGLNWCLKSSFTTIILKQFCHSQLSMPKKQLQSNPLHRTVAGKYSMAAPVSVLNKNGTPMHTHRRRLHSSSGGRLTAESFLPVKRQIFCT